MLCPGMRETVRREIPCCTVLNRQEKENESTRLVEGTRRFAIRRCFRGLWTRSIPAGAGQKDRGIQPANSAGRRLCRGLAGEVSTAHSICAPARSGKERAYP